MKKAKKRITCLWLGWVGTVMGDGRMAIRDEDVNSTVWLRPRLTRTHTETTSRAMHSQVVAKGRETIVRVGESVSYLLTPPILGAARKPVLP